MTLNSDIKGAEERRKGQQQNNSLKSEKLLQGGREGGEQNLFVDGEKGGNKENVFAQQGEKAVKNGDEACVHVLIKHVPSKATYLSYKKINL